MSPQNVEDAPSRVVASRAWYGELPAHWTLSPARAIFSEVKSVGHGSQTMLSVTIARGVIPQATLLAGSSKKDSSNLDKSKYKLVEVGDIAYNKMRAWQGAIGLSRYRGIVSPAYVVVRPRNMDAKYLENLMRTPAFAKEAERWSYGITSDMWSLRPEHFKMIYFPVPPADEQAAIVKYLGHAHARIDRAIAAKRKLIALLEEQKQAIIHQAVTRGLDPTVPLKDSGIPWLGEIPAHWDAAALRYRYTQTLGKMLDGKRNVGANPIPYLRNTDVQWGQVRTADLPLMDITPQEYPGYTVSKGDVLVCEGGEVGRAAIWHGEGLVGFQKALHRLRPLGNEVPEFLLLVLRTAKDLGAFDNGRVSTIAHLTGEQLRSARFAWPPPGEQRAIVSAVGQQNGHIDALRARVDREIELLREFRTRLTSDVVTGQVDVREIAATLPELTDDMLASTGSDTVDTDLEDVDDFTEGEDD